MIDFETIGRNAVEAKKELSCSSVDMRNSALMLIADSLDKHKREIIEQNRIDVKAAEKAGMSDTMTDRLYLNEKRILDIADGVRKVAALPDPVGIVEGGEIRPNGLKITKISVPMGVIGIIYESRPNVTVDAGVLCLKSGNAVILRGGKEAIYTNTILAMIMRDAVEEAGLPKDSVQLVEDVTRQSTEQMMKANGVIDLLIPRGGAGLINAVVQNATVPVIQTGTGNCHIYVDSSASIPMAVDIVNNAKTSRPSVCNAAETLLVHKDIAEDFLPALKKRLDKLKVELRGCELTKMILGKSVVPATEEDYEKEFLDYILAVKVVDNIYEAIEHIQKYSSGHSECIVTESVSAAEEFQKRIDAAAVYVNASTRFTDGYEFGLGAEIGISTQKLHARGPMGLREMTTYKYLITGNGQIR
ncbi:MAG: glutamate-5-semialdehyde dehydrogenase [Oscillospiraceae bacterium]|nr:glutamate-5-semialdehyde dehydrogenase [Ruminococcus sp.]MCD8344683.1 glutamate-5-semialdehyde dehydrogenase [Oscillospiraceae bacterium]